MLYKNSLKELQQLREKAESSLNKTAQLQQVIAQIEAKLLRRENQKVTEKSQN